jgi:hypothetical protein
MNEKSPKEQRRFVFLIGGLLFITSAFMLIFNLTPGEE